MMERLKRWLGSHLLLLLSLFVIAFIPLKFVFSEGLVGVSDVDTCSEVLSACQPKIVTVSKHDLDYTTQHVLALTDYAHYITYKVVFQIDPDSSTDTTEFINQVAQTLSDNRGWVRAGYTFNRVQLSADADFSLTLIKAEVLGTIPGCDSTWSCRSGNNVYINENRWNGATDAWNKAGGSLRDYRHMVVNHEVGHWLGLGHSSCTAGSGELAPVMQQQSIDLKGCAFNPWPLQREIDLLK